MNQNPETVPPPYISALVDELATWIAGATAPGVRDEARESYSLRESAVNAQLHALGWDAVLADTGQWKPIPVGYTIVCNPPDPHFYPHRCYQMPEGPEVWRTLWEGEREVRFVRWREAYAYVFRHLAQEQAQLPRQRFCVRAPGTQGGDDYMALSADHALQLHLQRWVSLSWITPQRAVELQLAVFEHRGERTFYCAACQHAPCKYTPEEKWPMSAAPGWIGDSL